MTRLWPLVVLLAFLTPAPAAAVSEYQGEVVRILDGDTIEVLHNNKAERIRLHGIDCPEKGQAYGNNAKHAASNLAFGMEVTLQTHGLDKYGRTLADVLLPDSTTLLHEFRWVQKVCEIPSGYLCDFFEDQDWKSEGS
jgi:endonuclease YncB( thermonuclease family)